MASTVLPNGIIVPEKFSRDWYADLYHNWQELDNLLGGGGANDGTLTIQKNGDTVGTFSANQSTDETVNIEVPTATSELTNDSGYITGVSWNDVTDKPTFATVATSGSYGDLSDKPTIPTVNDATLTIQKNGVTVDTFTANSSSDKTVNIQCVDLNNNQTVGGNKEFTGTTTAHDLVPSATDTYNFGSPSYQWNNAYIKSLTINGVVCGDILTHNASEFVGISGNQTIAGTKTFTASPRVTKTFPDIALNISDCDVTEIPTEAKVASLYFRDKNNKNLAYIAAQQRLDGRKRMCLRTHRTDDINSYHSVDLDSDGDFYPEKNNAINLGTPALQWNNTYTRNILINNDINIASSLINKTSSSGSLSLRGGTNHPDGASIIMYGKDYNSDMAGTAIINAYGNSDYTNLYIYPNGTMSVYNNSTGTTKNLAMQEDVDTLLSGKANSSHTHTTSDITDFPTLATVATSGSYNDLSNKPTISYDSTTETLTVTY